MAQLTINVDTALIPRLLAAYSATDNASLKRAIIDDIKSRVVSYEAYLADSAEQAKIEAAEEARRTKVATAESTASSEIVLS